MRRIEIGAPEVAFRIGGGEQIQPEALAESQFTESERSLWRPVAFQQQREPQVRGRHFAVEAVRVGDVRDVARSPIR